MMKKLYVVLLSMFVAFSSHAGRDYGRTITSVGTQNGIAYFTVSPAISATCLWDVLYVDSSVVAGRLQYALLLTAYSTGKMLLRIDYDVRPDGTCWVSLANF